MRFIDFIGSLFKGGTAEVTTTSLLSRARLRSDRESRIIKLLTWQSCFDDGPHHSQRALGRQFGLYPSYVCKALGTNQPEAWMHSPAEQAPHLMIWTRESRVRSPQG
jgi:hypothetical protein